MDVAARGDYRMALWKVKDDVPQEIVETKIRRENLLEEHIEEWIAKDPAILGEPLLIVGRQVLVADVKDRLDLLALDPNGNAVVIELKRGALKDPVDMQALRYASYIAQWKFQDFEMLARNYHGKSGDPEFNFNEMYESFCSDSAVDDPPDINENQRMIIVGTSVRDKLGSVALWLFEHGIDIKVVELHAYKSGDDLLLEPSVVVPLPVNRFESIGVVAPAKNPWNTDGRLWHLEKRCSPRTREMVLRIDEIVQDRLEVDPPRWNQKYYIAYRKGNINWLALITRPTCLVLRFLVRQGEFKAADLAARLGIEVFDISDSLGEKLSMPSSVTVIKRNDRADRVDLRIKDDFDLEQEAFSNFLQEMYSAFPS